MIWTMKPTAKKLEDVETKVGNVGNTDLQSQVTALNNKVGNVGGTDLQSQVNTLNSKFENGESVTITASSGMTVVSQSLKKYGSIVAGTVIMAISASANADTEIATIPSGSRPAASYIIPVYMNATGLFNQTASIAIRSNGKIIAWTTQDISSKQVSFAVSYHV